MPKAINAALLSILAAVGAARADAVPTELRFACTEQPATRVVVGADGAVASETVPPAATQPMQIKVVNLQHRTEGPNMPARIDSDAEELSAETALWQPGNSVDADHGRLRLDLTDGTLYLLEPKLGSQALFRRFRCDTQTAADARTHYRCGADFELWVSFADPSTANIRYSGGTLELPQVRAASGARYASEGNEFWTKGDEALFQLSGSEQRRCQVSD
ncbi:MAG: MliC family protein [Thiohalocapsa sp.]|nr:MliC family protein [Thiohalocapsa sp.]